MRTSERPAESRASVVTCALTLPLVQPYLDERLVAHLPHTILKRLVGLALPHRELRLRACAVDRDVLLAPLQDFDQVPAERCTTGGEI